MLTEIKKNVPNKKWTTSAGLTPDKLRELYLTQTDSEIATHYGVSDVIISKYRRKWDIPTVTMRQRRERDTCWSGPSLDTLTPEKLTELYQQMGDQKIAEMYGVAKPAIMRLREQWGVVAISKTERVYSRSEDLTDEQKEVVIGTLLGDGYMEERGVLKVFHSHAQFGYLRRIHALLSPITSAIGYEEKKMPVSGNLTYAFGFHTKQCRWLCDLHTVFYPVEKKVFPAEILNKLTERSLAYWYFDDGHIDSGLPSIALGDISTEAAEEVARLLQDRFCLKTYVRPQSTETCKQIGFRSPSSDVFFYLIREFATEDMLYKLPQKHWPQGLVPRKPINTKDKDTLSKDMVARCKAWKKADTNTQNSVVSDLVSFWHSFGFPHQKPRPEEVAILQNMTVENVLQEGTIKNRQVGQATCHAFAQHIWSARSYGSKHSPVEIFQDPDLLAQAIRYTLSASRIPNGSNIRSALRFLRHSGVYNFRPSAAKILVDNYCRPGGTVWDPCAGYGGRLLGTLCSNALVKYVACEPQSETHARLHHLLDWLDIQIPGAKSRVTLHNIPAEDFVIAPTSVDMVLTSPPYWKREVYGDEPTQSSVRYSTYDAWLAGFWAPVIQKALAALRVGGWLVLNVDDFIIERKHYSLITDTIRLVGLGEPTERYLYGMPKQGNPDNAEVVLCWVKP